MNIGEGRLFIGGVFIFINSRLPRFCNDAKRQTIQVIQIYTADGRGFQ
jgi:hypothetical protein